MKLRQTGRKLAEFFLTHKRWWVFFALVMALCLALIFFGQNTSMTSFIYVLF